MRIISKFKKKVSRSGFRHAIAALLATVMFIVSYSPIVAAADLKLIDAVTLKENSTKWVILDARPKSEWEAGHIPGAIQFSWDSYTHTDARGIQYSSFPPKFLAAVLAGLGIDGKTPIVVYGDADKSWGGEGYNIWLLSWLGHKGPIRLLNGGIQAWRNQNLPLDTGPGNLYAKKSRYQIDLKPQYIVSTEEVQKGNGSFVLVDVRSNFEWFKGRIPGAIHIPWEDFYTGKERRPLSSAELKKLLVKHGVDTSKPVVYYCLGGVRSAFTWMVHQLAGLPDARNYKGGWAAWEKRTGQ
jgi:thiosulfate/3-mercaptopyruvate sulfurtransferase